MTFRQFTALATVAEHGNVTKAAQAMRISQPSLSKHLKALEEDYRIRPFARNGKGIQLTEDGAEFLMRIDPILAQLKNIQERYLNNSKQKQLGPLRVGRAHVLSSNVFPFLAVFRKHYPNVEVVIRSNVTSSLEHMLLKGHLEVALTSILPHLPELTAELFVPLKVVAFAAKRFRLPPGKQLSLADLQNLALIIWDDATKAGQLKYRCWSLKARDTGQTSRCAATRRKLSKPQ
jgi:DNA-binding transcriptional LysR family regulator